ncbi:5-(carboxyamino)imidazole ribonucleotide synthase [Deinococcus detaillensis]|uniref:N5-carboxyaminoimidazole ribonucleotide synthase n=1 Tax=Deinococcus detaillensis TaxID=2592048 RepID=A0A553V431_9DEIO|nr:5-(carboxyamino)imidazole ribonucleotide synthase [Deinococcus detaillensis]TSA87206.1 5-(carboxyamino)imidazole ribonucleotide synthase [Deinococcus detaillensis]
MNPPPSATLGILGGGQLAQMLALAAVPLGVRVVVLEPDPLAPAQVCAEHLLAPYNDPAGLARLAECDAVTLEFENVSVEALSWLAGRVPLRPAGELLHLSKHRTREKEALRRAGAATAPFVSIESESDLEGALEKVGGRGVLKTSELGYDGKGQVRVSTAAELLPAWNALGRRACVLEGWVEFAREVSLGVARNAQGQLAYGGLIENIHVSGVLRRSLYLPGDTARAAPEPQARRLARSVAENWELEGLLTLEFFELPSGKLIVNEVAPRVHNSGHLTQDGGGLSQFEAQVRAALNWPLQDFAPKLPCVMVNILGWPEGQEPDWQAILKLEGTRLHLYGKAHQPGRKLGHVNLVAREPAELLEKLAVLETLIPQ